MTRPTPLAIVGILIAVSISCLLAVLAISAVQQAKPPAATPSWTLLDDPRSSAASQDSAVVPRFDPRAAERVRGDVPVPRLADDADESETSDPPVVTDPPQPVPYAEGHASKSLRNDDFPSTYISAIHVNLTSPDHRVELTWSGPQADRMETGPFRSSPGAGLGYNNCDDPDESNRNGSNCTPKGTWAVQGFSDYLRTYPACQFVTWFNIPREVAFHYHWQVPRYPASHGCVRLDRHAAQLIHNNSLVEKTQVTVDGTWTRRGR